MSVDTVGVVGLGLLGKGIAACFLGHGFRVVGYTRRSSTFAAARQAIARAMKDCVQRAGLPASLIDDWKERYTETTSFEPLTACDFVVESVVEDLAVKNEGFDEIEAVVNAVVPIASNTSALPISRLQGGRRHPERFLGMHWAEPAHATRFLEIIRGARTSDAAFSTTAALARRIGKEPSLVKKDVPAFVVNRLGYAMYREALHLVESGVADVETVDRSFRNAVGLWATLCGPFRWIDISGGPALYARAMKGVLPTLSNASELPETLESLLAAGATGATGGRGFYTYTKDEAQRWEALYEEHAWRVRELVEEYFPERDGAPGNAAREEG